MNSAATQPLERLSRDFHPQPLTGPRAAHVFCNKCYPAGNRSPLWEFSMNAPLIDQKARDMAQAALNKMDVHEQVCAQRWGTALLTMQEIKRVITWAAAGLISSMAGLIAWLATHPPQ